MDEISKMLLLDILVELKDTLKEAESYLSNAINPDMPENTAEYIQELHDKVEMSYIVLDDIKRLRKRVKKTIEQVNKT